MARPEMPPPTMTTSKRFSAEGGVDWPWLGCAGVRGWVFADVKMIVPGWSKVFRLGLCNRAAKKPFTAIATTFEYTSADQGCQSKEAFAARKCARRNTAEFVCSPSLLCGTFVL